MNTITNALANLFNRINDSDWTWIGFRRLKPAQSERMSFRTVMILSAFYAPATGLTAAVLLSITEASGIEVWLSSIASAAAFVVLQSLSAYFWNQRASRMQ